MPTHAWSDGVSKRFLIFGYLMTSLESRLISPQILSHVPSVRCITDKLRICFDVSGSPCLATYPAVAHSRAAAAGAGYIIHKSCPLRLERIIKFHQLATEVSPATRCLSGKFIGSREAMCRK